MADQPSWLVPNPPPPSTPPSWLVPKHDETSTGNPVANFIGGLIHSKPVRAAGDMANTAGRLLDAQRYGLARAVSGKTTTDDQMTALRQHIPAWLLPGGLTARDEHGQPMRTLDDMYQATGRITLPTPNLGDGHQGVPIGHALQGATDVALQTLTDPLTYETAGAGPLLKAAGITAKSLQALNALHATPFGQRLATVMRPAAQGVQEAGNAVHDFFHWGGEVKRERGAATVNTIRGAANRASATGARVQQHLTNRFDAIVKDLTPEERVKVGQALNGEIPPPDVRTVSPKDAALHASVTKQQSAYRQLRTLTEMDYRLRLDAARTIAFRSYAQGLSEADQAALRKAFASGKPPTVPQPAGRVRTPDISAQTVENRTRAINAKGPTQTLPQQATGTAPELLPKPSVRYTFKPANQAAIDHAQMLLDRYHQINNTVLENMPKRENYMPWAHGEAPKPRPTQTINKTNYFDPRAQEREDVQVTTADQVKRGFEAMASNTNRQVTSAAIHTALGSLLDDPKIAKLFEQTMRATGADRTRGEKWRDAWLAMVGYPRAAVVSITPRHAANILDLLANTVPPDRLPSVMKDTMTLAGKLVSAKSAKEYAALTKPGRDIGALSGSFAERKPFFQEIPVVRNWTALNNKLVWAVDEAAKQTYAKLLVEMGEAEGLEAGGKASARLVDYEHLAPIQKALRYVAPFGTFRGGIPGAVVGGIARNPARAALLNRATGGAMYGGKPGPNESGMTLYNPTADVGRMFDYSKEGRFTDSGVGDFVRGTLGAPPQALLNAGQDLIGQPGHWASYGQSWMPRRGKNGQLDLGFLADSALAGVPEAQTILESMGISRFKWKGLAHELGRQAFGVNVQGGPPPAPPTP